MNLIRIVLVFLFVILLTGCSDSNNQNTSKSELIIDQAAASEFKAFLKPIIPNLISVLSKHGLTVDENDKESIKIKLLKYRAEHIQKGVIQRANVTIWAYYQYEGLEDSIDLPDFIWLEFARVDNKWNLLLFNGYVQAYSSENSPNEYETPDYHQDIKSIFPNHIEFGEYIRLDVL